MHKEILYVQSETNPEQIYELNPRTLECTCKSYYYRSKTDSRFVCKHLKKKFNIDHKPSLLYPDYPLKKTKVDEHMSNNF